MSGFQQRWQIHGRGCGEHDRCTRSTGEIRVWNVAENKEAAYRNDYSGAVLSVSFTPDSKTIVSVGQNQAPSLWSFPEKDKKTFSSPDLTFTPQPFLAAAVSPDGSLLAFSGETPSVFVYNRTENKMVAELTGHEDVVGGSPFPRWKDAGYRQLRQIDQAVEY